MKPTLLSTIIKSVVTLLALFVLAGCGSSTSGVSSTTGAAVAKLVWQEAPRAVATKAAAPAGVTTVRVIITAAGMTTIQQDYAAAAGSGTISGIPIGTNRTFTFQGLNAGNSVTHQAVVNNVTISSGQTTDLGTVTMLVAVAPAAPGTLTATVNSASRIDLAWSDTDTLETGFVIERKTGAGGTWAQIATVAAGVTSYSNAGLNAATAYYYRVKATNSAGDSAWASEANATTNSPAIQLAKTGQTTSYAAGDDGDLEKGVAWPALRFTDNANGTVTDNLTGLIWLKNANCFGTKTWADALTSANTLASGACGLTDGSTAGQWRLPNVVELDSLIDTGRYNPALPAGHPFSNVQFGYCSSSSYAGDTTVAWWVFIDVGADFAVSKGSPSYVWPVRAGQ